MKITKNIILAALLLVFLHCKKHIVVNENTVDGPNQALKFTFTDSNQFYKRFNPDSVTFGLHTPNWVYTIKDGQKNYLNYTFYSRYNPSVHNRDLLPVEYYFSFGDIPSKVLSDSVYIAWPKGKVDTFVVDYFIADQNPNLPNTCNCWTPLRSLKLNGKAFLKKTNYDKNGIYLFE